MKEHRLLHRTIREINRQRIMSGSAPITSAENPTGKPSNARTAQSLPASQTTYQATPVVTPTAKPSGYTPTLATPYASVEDADAAARDEYEKTGSVSRKTEARGEVTRDPSLLTKVGPTDYTVRGRDLTTPKVGKSIRSQTIAKGGIRTAKIAGARPLTGADLKTAVDKRRQKRLMEQGIPETAFNEINEVMNKGGRVIEEVDGIPVFLMPDGTRRTIGGVSGTTVRKAIDIGKQDFETEVKTEQEQKTAEELSTASQERETGKVPTAIDTAISNLKSQAATNPDLAGTLPMIEAIEQYKAEQDAELERVRVEAEAEMNNTDKDGDGVTDGVEEAAEAERLIVAERDEKERAINLENKRISEEAAKLAKDMAQLEKDKFELSQNRNENLQREANVEAEMKNRRVAAKLGINYDTNGLKWMATEIRKGTEALTYLINSGDIQSSQFALSIGREYNVNMRSALNNYNAQQLQIDTNFKNDMKAIRSMVSTDATERRKEKKELQKEMFRMKSEIDIRASNDLKWAYDTMQKSVKDAQESRIKKEDDALDKIDYLLKNYPRESVAEAIRELGQDVTSFDVQTLIDNPTFSEIQKAEAAMLKKRTSGGGGSGYVASYLPGAVQSVPKPSVTLQEYEQRKIAELESKEFQSFSVSKRAKILAENADEWQKEYEAIYTSGLAAGSMQQSKTDLVSQFGQSVVDAAGLVIDGTYGGTNGIKNVSKALNVPESAVATAVTKLKQTGAVSESAILSPQQQSSRDKIITNIKGDTFYTVWNGAKSAATRIQTAIGDSGGADGISDIMAINAFQNGIVDPGATVREGDVALFQSAKAWSQKVKLSNWIEKIADGDKLPPEMRAQMLALTLATRDAYGRDFQAETVPKMRALIKQNGLPSTVLDEYLGGGGTQSPTVSPKVQKFSDTYFSQ